MVFIVSRLVRITLFFYFLTSNWLPSADLFNIFVLILLTFQVVIGAFLDLDFINGLVDTEIQFGQVVQFDVVAVQFLLVVALVLPSLDPRVEVLRILQFQQQYLQRVFALHELQQSFGGHLLGILVFLLGFGGLVEVDRTFLLLL